MSWKCDVHVCRQMFLLTAKCIISYSTGVALAFPSVLNPAILASDSDINVTPDQASWIVTSLGISIWLGYIIIPLIFEIYGRRITNIAISLLTLVGGLTFYVANGFNSLVLGRLIQGLSLGGNYVSVVAICECISPKRRGYFMVLYKVSMGLGSLACHSLAFILNWRQIAICGALPSCIAILFFIICAESPSFLAKRGQFDKCIISFEWYRGNALNAETELNELLKSQKESIKVKENAIKISIFKKLFNMIKTKEFRKSFFIVTLSTLCIDTSGRYFLVTYITQILIQITENMTSAMYISVVFDCILIFSLCVSSILVKRFKRRYLLFKFGFLSVFLMFMVSASIILRNIFSVLKDVKWLTLSVLLLHAFIISVGLVPTAFTITGEVYSLAHRGLGSCISGIITSIFMTVIMKLTPVMINKTGVEGTYSIYGCFLCIFLVLLKFILPETKDKTLQQIEDEIKGIARRKSNTESVKSVKYSVINDYYNTRII